MNRRATPVSDEELLARAADLAAVPAPLDDRDPNGVLIVGLLGERFSIPTRAVREVVPHPMVTPLPTAPAFVAGVTNLRGTIVAVLDTAKLLQLPSGRPPRRFAIIVEDGDVVAALLVDVVDALAPAGSATPIDVTRMLRHPDLLPPDDVVIA
jgi:purine-binding chemotaxis protein CheW